ncbi:Abi family protein [soil metagenome]
MKYIDFESNMSIARMSRYLTACGGDTKKAMTLYRLNLRLSQELFTVISCFEILLRNKIDTHLTSTLGNDWLKNASDPGGRFDNVNCRFTANSIKDALTKPGVHYSHNKIVAELGFGFWRYMFASYQYTATGRTSLAIFPAKPTSTATVQYNANFAFNQLAQINKIRNRIAHHEPVCFLSGSPIKNTVNVRQHYGLILQFFQWMSIDEAALLYGLDHINIVCSKIDSL